MGLTLLISYSLFGHNDHRHHQVKPSESAEPDEQEDIRVRKEIRLYRCSDQDGTLRVSEVKEGPLLQSDLESALCLWKAPSIADHSPRSGPWTTCICNYATRRCGSCEIDQV